MFAHQAIEELKNDRYGVGEFSETLKNLIVKSHKFHMGDADTIKSLFQGDMGKEIFMGASATMMRLPYKTMWFDFTFANAKNATLPESSLALGLPQITNSKEAVFVKEAAPNIWQVFVFSFIQELKRWEWAPFMFLCFIGGMKSIIEDNKTKFHLGEIKTREFIEFIEKTRDKEVNVLPIMLIDLGDKEQNEKLTNVVTRECAFNFGLLQSAIKILNCKNITTEVIPAPERLNKKRINMGRTPLFSYHVLNVRRPTKHGEKTSGTGQDHYRLHMCRGHFKEFTAEKPLFGNVTGLFWWQPHLRGQADGAISKDYRWGSKI